MHAVKSILFVIFATMFSNPAFAVENSCQTIFLEIKEKTEPSIVDDRLLIQQHVDPKISEAIDAMKAIFLKPTRLVPRVLFADLTARLNNVTNLLAKIYVHAYPFSYVVEGVVPKVRLWSKTGSKEVQEEIEKWMKRYGHYQMNRQLYVEQAFFVRNEATQLENVLKQASVKYPIEIMTPKYIRNGLIEEIKTYTSRNQVSTELKELKMSQTTMFGRNYSTGAFLRARDVEQAHLAARLKIVRRELKNNPLATTDAQLRQKMIKELDILLEDPNNTATPSALYIEARRALTDEIGYFTGSRELTDQAQEIVDTKLFQNDIYNLGLDRERLGIVSRTARNLVVHAPSIVLSALAVVYSPMVKEALKDRLFPAMAMHEIASLPQRQYEEKSLQFLKEIYKVKIVNGQAILNSRAEKALRTLKENRVEHIAELREQNITQETFDFILNGIDKSQGVTAEEFKSLMELPPDEFPVAATEFAAKQTSEAKSKNLLEHLVKSYEVVHAQNEASDPEAKAADKIFDAFAIFVLRGEKVVGE